MTKLNVLTVLVLCFPIFARAEDELKFELVSSAFMNGQEIPKKYTCIGSDINPPLELKNVPPKTKTFALSVIASDLPESPWVQWAVYNIPTIQTSIAENAIPGTQIFNDFGNFNYAGPCPSDDKEHRYVIMAYALSESLDLKEGIILDDLHKAMQGRIIARSELTGTFRKSF